jgi:predicted NAD/FAD-dependent oxidoreductase
VRRQLGDWFGGQVEKWTHLRSYTIRHGLPGQAAPGWKRSGQGPRVSEGLYCCGDYTESASIQGAMLSGRRAAEVVAAELDAGFSD